LERYSFNAEYVSRLKVGDPATQRHFIRYFSDLLSIKLRPRLRSPQLVEEARQETFLRVFTALHRDGIDQPERLGAYVNSVCNNVVFELYRHESRNPNLPEDAPEPLDDRPGIEAGIVTAERKAFVERALDELPAKDRQLLREVFIEERDKDAICKDFQVDREYLRVLLHRAKSRLKAILEEQNFTNVG
jgi:RNA polymerase sigma-70 factor, ECF subfamily